MKRSARPTFCAALAAFASLSASACKTTEGRDESAPQAEAAKADGEGLAAHLDLTRADGQGLYLKMLSIEVSHGVTVPPDQLHTSRGLIECKHDGALEPCTVRIRLNGDDLSSTQPLGDNLAASVWGFVRGTRPELTDAKAALADLVCDYIGKKSPPYNLEEVHCSVSLPRAPDEAVFDARLSAEVAEAIRGDAPYKGDIVTLSGNISCQWLPGSQRAPCVARSFAGGVLSDKLTELSAGGAAQAARLLRQALLDHAQLSGQTTAAPAEITGGVACIIDNRKVDTDGKRGYVCRATI